MYKKILVPLDGSQFSQCSLEHVRTISRGCQGSEIILFRVVEGLSPGSASEQSGTKNKAVSQLEEALRKDALEYVTQTAKRLREEGLSVKAEIASGKADEEIINYSRKNRVDLIIMSSHGASGLSQWTLGSVADRVVHYSTIPVLLVATPGCRVAQG